VADGTSPQIPMGELELESPGLHGSTAGPLGVLLRHWMNGDLGWIPADEEPRGRKSPCSLHGKLQS